MLKIALVALAALHVLPAKKHLALFFAHPGIDEAWKGFGAALAVLFYLAPYRWVARAFGWLWRERRAALRAGGFVLAAVHLVPACDHIPAFVRSPSWGDAWRGVGASAAALWFMAPLPVQVRLFIRGRRLDASLALFTRSLEASMSRLTWFVAATGAALGASAFLLARLATESWAQGSVTVQRPPMIAMHVPRATTPVITDGELDEAVWRGRSGRTGAFLSTDGVAVNPYSEARLSWDEGGLNVALYAADENVVTSGTPDAFELRWVTTDGHDETIRVSAGGEIADREGNRREDWERLVRRGSDLDGTLDDSRDDDEEWILELAIPYSVLHIRGTPDERVSFSVRRCDTPKGRETVCGAWPRTGQSMLILAR